MLIRLFLLYPVNTTITPTGKQGITRKISEYKKQGTTIMVSNFEASTIKRKPSG